MSAEVKVKGLIFDLDGTLLDTLEDLRDSCNHVMAAHGYPECSLENTRYYVGEGLRRMLGMASGLAPQADDLARTGMGEKIEPLLADMTAWYGANWAVKSRPYAGIPEMLARLAAAGVPTAVLSNKAHEFTVEMVAHFFPGHPFVRVEGMKDNVPAKPHPDGALKIAARLGLAPAELGFVGDTRVDMLTAGAAGMRPIGVTWGFRPRQELLEHGAAVLLERPEDIFSCL